MKKKLNDDTLYKILSLFLAVLLWFMISNINDPVTTKTFDNVEVKIINENALTDNGYTYNIQNGNIIPVHVKGKKSVIESLSSSDFNAVADFYNLSLVDKDKKLYVTPIDVSANKYSEQLEISTIKQHSMEITEDKLDEVNVAVNVVVSGEPANGYAFGKITGTPNLVSVTGPKKLLKEIKEIKAEIKDVNNVSKDITTYVKPVLYDKNGKKINSPQITMDVSKIEATVNVWKTKEVNVNLKTEGELSTPYKLLDFSYEPHKIMITAPDSTLKDLKEIDLKNVNITGKTKSYETEIKISENIIQDNVKPVDEQETIKVKTNIEKLETKEINFDVNKIKIKGKKDRNIIYDKDNKYTATVEGLPSDFAKITEDDFSPWIDVSKLEEGEYVVPLHVKDLKNLTVEKTENIKIKIQ